MILAVLPLSFDAGFSQLTTAFHVGAHVVLHELPAAARRHHGSARKHSVTGLTGVPPLWIQLAEQPWPDGDRRTRCATSPTPAAACRRRRSTSCARLPAGAAVPDVRPDRGVPLDLSDPAEVDRRPDSIGKAIPNAEILVVRADGTPCEPDEPGELVHRGALVALGYWNDPETTAERFKPRRAATRPWRAPEMAVWSGDTVVRDEEGFLYFVGRSDEMIKTSGYRVSPTEIEEVAVRDRAGRRRRRLRRRRPGARPGDRARRDAQPTAGSTADDAARRAAAAAAAYMVPRAS